VFDSSFDEVVRVPYLKAGQARELLRGRITDVAPAFLGLAYCQSGGLPRDLLRATDRIISLGTPEGEGSGLSEVAGKVVHQDLAGKTSAVSAAIKSVVVEPAVSSVLRAFQKLDSCMDSQAGQGPCLLDASWLNSFKKLEPLLSAQASQDVAERRTLLRLTQELLGYFYYCRTLLELFTVDSVPSVDRLAAAVEDNDGRALNELARARQDFAVNPFLAWEQVSALRKQLGLKAYALPVPLTVNAVRVAPVP
jgi:hypothetical protein